MTGPNVADVVVVGTGVVGLAAAHALLARGLTVTVLGPRPAAAPGQGSAAAGAMLSPFSEVDASQLEARVELEVGQRLKAFARYPAWLDELAAASGQPPLPLIPGTWVVAAADERDDLAAIARAAHGATHSAELHHGTEHTGLAPETAPATALWLPTEPSLDITRLLQVLAAAVTGHRNARWCESPARSVVLGRTAVSARCADGTIARGGQVVVAAGAGIPALLGELGTDLAVPPVLAGRGVSLVLNTPLALAHTVRTPNAAFACGTHLVPRTFGTAYLGATNRLALAPDIDGPATLDELATLIRDATRVLDHRLAAAGVQRVQVGYRPYTLDHLPLVGPTADPRVLLATATYRCGVLLAPLMADLIADEITEPGSLACHPYRVDRPMPRPPLRDLLTPTTVRGLAEHLIGSAAARRQLTALFTTALPVMLAGHDPLGSAAERVLAQAPVAEVLPSLLALIHRLEARPCPVTPSIPPPRSSTPQPVSETTVPVT